ncbi:MAG: TetR/AcrR family transcriptional regulator [Propionicimonas sp.]
MTAGHRRAAAKRQQIIDAARELFLENGFAGSSMDAVVARAGVSKQTLYRYFPSKTELLAAVLASEVDTSGIFSGPPPQPETAAELRVALIGIAHTLTHEMLSTRRLALIRLVLGEAFRIPELRDAIRDLLPGQLLHRTQAVLAHAASRGLVHSERPELSARMYIGPIFSFVVLDGLLRADPLPPPATADLEYLVDTFLRSVEP